MSAQEEVLIIGTGLSGCAAAWNLAQQGINVLMITRTAKPEQTATDWAQGGIVYKSPKESGSDLVKDILEAGCYLNNPKAVDLLAKEGPQLVEKVLLQDMHVPFDKNEKGHYLLAEEAAHSFQRILFHGDTTGQAIERSFLQKLSQHPKVRIWTKHTAIDLLTLAHHSLTPEHRYEPSRCIGAYVYDQEMDSIKTLFAKEVILATGGLGQIFLHTTNPVGARGDGLAMAYRTGARIMNLEFIQFHPTALFQKTGERFLISEAVRGEGGKLRDIDGHAFMHRYDPRLELAPRDVVARAIHDQILQTGAHFVYLDISHRPAAFIKQRFPGIFEKCLSLGIDMTQEPIPVVPAAHYACGGVYVDETGQTSVKNLWAVGEVSCTGLHGANRLASTSLLEDLVWGTRAGNAIAGALRNHSYSFPKVKEWQGEHEAIDMDLVRQDWLTLKHTMWNYVGLVRTPKRLDRAKNLLMHLRQGIETFYKNSKISDELIGLRNASLAANLVLEAALRNHRSIGCHYIANDTGSDK